jgi:MFS family permease
MKQTFRLLVRPKTFFNQLQWSSHHGLLLFAFALVALVETQVGRQQALFQILAQAVERETGLSALWATGVVALARFLVLLGGAFLVAQLTWFVGNFFGRRSSRRVLFRRLAVVFTVLLGGYVAQQLMSHDPRWVFIVIGAYLWSAVLAYFAFREQFALSHVETMVLGALCLLAIATGWHYSRRATDVLVTELLRAQRLESAANADRADRIARTPKKAARQRSAK